MPDQYGVEDSDGFVNTLMVEAGPLKNAAALMLTLTDARKLYTDVGNAPPPFPDSVATFPPCSILVTERRNISTGERLGRVRFFRLDGTGLSDQTWTIAEPRK